MRVKRAPKVDARAPGRLYAISEGPGIVMDEMGHTDPALALRVYRQSMRRDEGEKARLRAVVAGGRATVKVAVIGSRAAKATDAASIQEAA